MYRRLSDAIEVLAANGQWEPLIGYLDIVVGDDYFVTLPRDVECPIKINIDRNPSFSRAKIFEFTMNSAGADMEETGFAWLDQGAWPVFVQPPTPHTIKATGDAADAGKKITLVGRNEHGVQLEETITVNGGVSQAIFYDLTAVGKQVTTKPVNLLTSNDVLLAPYTSNEVEPRYRRIKLSKKAVQVRMMFRRVTRRVTGPDDYIPLHSSLALVLMVRALTYYRSPSTLQEAPVLEAQAIKLITQKDASVNVHHEVSEATEVDSATGSVYRDGTILIVADIYDDASKLFGPIGRAKLFDRITDAIELLVNKGNWDSLLAYLDIKVGHGNLVTLPDDVETPLLVNINNQPSFARSRAFEFTLNTPGSEMGDTAGFTWDDRGRVAVFVQPTRPLKIYAAAENSADNGTTIEVVGQDKDGVELRETLTMHLTDKNESVAEFAKITFVQKPKTTGFVSLKTKEVNETKFGDNYVLSRYYPEETYPQYRQIKLSVSAAAVRMLYRRKTYKVSALTDIIPLRSKLAMSIGLRAVKAYLDNAAEAEGLTKSAIALLKDIQDLRDSIPTSDVLTPTNTSINNREGIIAADVYDDASGIFGPIGRAKLLDKISDAVELLANKKPDWDGLVGYVDILTEREQFLTLPRFVETPLAINVGGRPASPRNEFFEFHMNGPGSDCEAVCGSWIYKGEVCTLRDVLRPSRLFAKAALPGDVDTEIRVYGYDQNNHETEITLRVQNSNLRPAPLGDSNYISRITRITKSDSRGAVTLYAEDDTGNVMKIGIYDPDESEPVYTRLLLPTCCAWVRMRYRKRTLRVMSLYSPLHLKNKLSVVLALQALKAQMDKDFKSAEAAEMKAVQYLAEEQYTRRPATTFTMQFERRGSPAHNRAIR